MKQANMKLTICSSILLFAAQFTVAAPGLTFRPISGAPIASVPAGALLLGSGWKIQSSQLVTA